MHGTQSGVVVIRGLQWGKGACSGELGVQCQHAVNEPVGPAWAHGGHATAAVWGRKLVTQGQGSMQGEVQ